jgi:prolyl oligopeptidase
MATSGEAEQCRSKFKFTGARDEQTGQQLMPGIEWPDGNDRISYPVPEISNQEDDFHGTVIADPYRHLEDLGSPTTQAWVAAQDQLTQRLLAGLPARPAIEARLAEIWSRPSPGIPFERGGRWFQRCRPAGAEQDVLYAGESADSCERVLLDPGALSSDTSAMLVNVSVSPDGSAVAYSVSESGSDWQTWHVRDAVSAADLDDRVHWSKLDNAVWHPDGSGFYYTRLTAPRPGQELTEAEQGSQVYFHRSGTRQKEDTEVFVPDDHELWPAVSRSTDDRYLIVSLSRGLGSGTDLRILELARPGSGFRVLLPPSAAERTVVATQADVFYVLTDDNADRRRIIAVPAAGSAHGQCRDVVPESPDTLLEAHLFSGRLICHYLRDACSVLKVFELDGSPAGEIATPELCTLSGSQLGHERIEGTETSDIVHFETETFTQSPTLWRHDLGSGQTTRARAAAVTLPAAHYLTERVFVRSDDGTQVPLFLTRHRDLPRDGDARVLLYGYGGVGASFTPAFRADWATWIERGGMFALASLRGGGEYGSSWYRDGRRDRKQNVFDDFCACLRWLASSGWSRPSRIAITGGSNGGLLVGACLTQHPELFRAAVAQAGVFDLLRFHLFTDGWSWKPEYGDPDHPAESGWLAAYSPLHNTRPGPYPATLLTTGDHDDRVVPSHTLKFGAALQAAQTASAPVIIRLYAGIGHGMPAISAVVAEQADSLAFLEAALST